MRVRRVHGIGVGGRNARVVHHVQKTVVARDGLGTGLYKADEHAGVRPGLRETQHFRVPGLVVVDGHHDRFRDGGIVVLVSVGQAYEDRLARVILRRRDERYRAG